MIDVSRRNVLNALAASTLMVLASGPATADDDRGRDDDGIAQVRVGHLSPDTPAVDVYVGRDEVDPTDTDPTIGGLGYQTFAPNAAGDYLDLRPGRFNIKVTPTGSPETVAIEANPVLRPNTGYTILAVGELSPEEGEDTTFSGEKEAALQPLSLVDFEGRGDSDEDADHTDETVMARFVHASPDAETVDIVVNGEMIASDVDFGDSTGYVTIDPGTKTIQITKEGALALEVTVELKEGDKVSAYVVGNAITDEEDDAVEEGTGLGGDTTERLNAVLTFDGKPPDDEEDDEQEEYDRNPHDNAEGNEEEDEDEED